MGQKGRKVRQTSSFLVKSYIPQRFSLKNAECCSCPGFIPGISFSSCVFSSSRYLAEFLLPAFVTSLPSRHPNMKVKRVLVDKTRLLAVNYQQSRDQSRVSGPEQPACSNHVAADANLVGAPFFLPHRSNPGGITAPGLLCSGFRSLKSDFKVTILPFTGSPLDKNSSFSAKTYVSGPAGKKADDKNLPPVWLRKFVLDFSSLRGGRAL